MILSVFSDRRRALTLSELSRLSSIPKATTLRLVRRLVDWGALERLEDGRYVIGVRLWEVASLSPRGHGVREIALPYLEDLYEATRHHVLLAVREGKEAVLIDRLSALTATEVAYRVGGRLPLRSTAVGLVLLAHAGNQVLEDVLAMDADDEEGAAHVGDSEIRRLLAGVKQTGISVVRRTAPSQTVSVAAPVRDASQKVVAALSVVIPDGLTPHQAVAPAVRSSARAISRSLGFAAPTVLGRHGVPGEKPHAYAESGVLTLS